jgi:hypothetical protein
MDSFSTTLLRERFIIRDPAPVSDEEPVIALSNRVVTPVPGSDEKFVVRAQNMHTCIRMAARIVHSAQEEGPIMSRDVSFDWEEAWKGITEGFEKKFNPRRWISVYHGGKAAFSKGEHHSFLDIVEACDFKNRDDYSGSIALAEEAFKKAGKVVTIEHDANIALVVNITGELARCGVILRGADKTTTFNFTAKPYGGNKPKISQCLTVSAAFLEGIQLAFQIGMGQAKRSYDLIESDSDENKKIDAGEKRISRLNGAILQFERMLDVTYRPERPNLFEYIEEAKEVSRKILAPQIQAKIASGEMDESEWVV